MERENKLKHSIDSSVKLNAAETAVDGSLFGETNKKEGSNPVESALDIHDQVNMQTLEEESIIKDISEESVHFQHKPM